LFFKKSFEEIYALNKEQYSLFLSKPYEKFESHPLFSNIMQMKKDHELNPPTSRESLLGKVKTVDDSLSLFYLGNCVSKNSTENLNLLKNLILFREGVNFLGWETIEIYKNYNIMPNTVNVGEYSMKFNSEDVPQITDDYLCDYLNFDSSFPMKKLATATFVMDFCNFLFENDLTNYKIEPIL
jgi:hypothetical protein